MKLRLHSFDLPLAHPFTISRETTTVQPTLVVELEAEGHRGFGEATSNRYYHRTIDDMMERLWSLRQRIESIDWQHPRDLWEELSSVLGDDPFAQCALDQAAYDLWGKLANQPVHRLLGFAADSKRPPSNYTIGIDTPERMVEKLAEYPDWPVYKVKLGTPEDLASLRALRQHTDATFRVDANAGWDLAHAEALYPHLTEIGVELIEQPFPEDQWRLIGKFKETCQLPLMADESCQREQDVETCAEQGFDGINIKLVKCGGLTPALRMMDKARSLGLKLMVGCMTESSVGISAIAQLLPGLDFVDMDGAVLLGKDIATGVSLDRGVCGYPSTIMGSGIANLAVDQAIRTLE